MGLMNGIHLSLSKGEAWALLLLDQSAEFDTIAHSTLLRCLQTWFGISGTILRYGSDPISLIVMMYQDWLNPFRNHRYLYNVRQGSVLGPILFSLYTTSLSKVIVDSHL